MEKPQPVAESKPSFIGYLWVTVVFLVVVFIGGFAYKSYRASQEEKVFMSKAPALVIACENLMAMAEQGVEIAEFGNLLATAKQQYDSIGAWPLKETDANFEFVQAIEGWTSAADVWKLKLEQNSEYAYQDVVDMERLSTYLGIGRSKLKFFTASDLVRQLIFSAGEHAKKGESLLGF
jgi:hypothetical protein